MATANDVAAYIVGKQGAMTTMKLQKLLYYCQGWSLAWDGVPMFEEAFEAWSNGPVCYDLFKQHRGQFTVDSWEKGDASVLSMEAQDTVDAVLHAYGHLSGHQLSDKTHLERPWIEARGDTPHGGACQTHLDLDTMQDYFGGLDQLD